MNRWLVAILAWMALVAATGAFRLWWRVDSAAPGWTVLVPTPELLLVWVLVLIGPKKGIGSAVRFLTWAAGGSLVVWNLGESFYRAFYRDHFNPFSDLVLLSGLLDMLVQTAFFRSAPGQIAVTVGIAALIVVLGWLVETASRRVTCLVPRHRFSLGVATGVLLLVAVGQSLVLGDSPSRQWKSWVHPTPNQTQGQASSTPTPTGPSGLKVFVLVVESYGHTLFTQKSYRDALAPAYTRWAQILEQGHWSVQSGFLRSSTFGGRSWLADATLLTGTRIRNQDQYDSVVRIGEPNLTQWLGEAGYFRILAAPGTLQADARWRQTFAFDRYLFDGDFGYHGPAIGGLGRLSDQFLLDRLGREAEAKSPVFALGILVSSHTPFQRLPVYWEDWDRLGDGSVYREPGGVLSLPGGGEGYLASIEYVFRCLEGFLARIPADVVIIVGDHQPLIPVSEAEATFSVPIHVLVKDPERLKGLAPFGLDPGLVPRDRPLPHPGLETLPRMLQSLLVLDKTQEPVAQVP